MVSSRTAIALALLAVYVIWGSTYLAIRFAVEEMPPFLMAAARWIVAGIALYAFRRAAGDAAPTRREWRDAAIIGALLIVGGNGAVSWAEQFIPSGFTALLIAIVPVWFALFVWAQTGARPTGRVWTGIALGFVGVALLAGPAAMAATAGSAGLVWGIGAVLLATILWALGSVHSRKATLPASPLLGASMQMIVGGVLLALLGASTGELARVDLAEVTWIGWASLAFLSLLGSIVAYSAYVWLLGQVQPQLVATYAFVNPIVAVALGALLAGEAFGRQELAAAVLIVIAVAIVVTAPRPAAAPPPRPAPPERAG